MARYATLKLLFLIFIIWQCDGKVSSIKSSSTAKKGATPVADSKVESTTTTKSETTTVGPNKTSDSVVVSPDPNKTSSDIKDETDNSQSDENSDTYVPIIKTVSKKCNKGDRDNEFYSQCGNNNCQATCQNPNGGIGCTGSCVAGCICLPGFLRNELGRCVLASQCGIGPFSGHHHHHTTTCSGPNEVYSFCGNDGCQPSCNRIVVSGCVSICNNPACVCAPGFVRNNQGLCVLPSSCQTTQTCNGQNEIFSNCGNDGCQRTCNRLDVSGCQSFCNGPACVCNTGFVRNSAGICVLPSSCQSQTCNGPNEVFSTCGEDGCQRTCSRLDVRGCQPICSTPRCICNVGFVRNAAGACVLPSSCPPLSCFGANEIFSFCGNDGCQRTCTRLDVTGCVPDCNIPACICAPGYVRSGTGACVLQASCMSSTTCGANEVFSTCGNDGCQRSCTRLDISNCVPICSVPSCVCAVGFVRNAAGACVLPSSCTASTCNGVNEVFSACGNDGCQRACNRLIIAGCVPICSTPACVCANGFVRNSIGQCVLPTTCATTCPGANEVFSACGDDGCQRTCTRLDVTGCNQGCNTAACICAPGFVRNAAGVCVAPSTCPSTTCTGANQIFSACGNDGCQRTCTRLTVTGCTATCGTPGCICAPGFVMNAAGNCVVPTTCPTTTCTGANQMFSACGDDSCQRSCTRLTVTACTATCGAPACVCLPGFVKNAAGDCIAPTACPATTCPGTNQMFSGCGDDTCQRTCTRLDVTNCMATCAAPACVCNPGFVRDAGGNCIAPTSCPTMTCGMNQVFSGCGNDGCQSTCTTPAPNPCTPACNMAACVCQQGFVMNMAGMCIAPTACPPPMGR